MKNEADAMRIIFVDTTENTVVATINCDHAPREGEVVEVDGVAGIVEAVSVRYARFEVYKEMRATVIVGIYVMPDPTAYSKGIDNVYGMMEAIK